MIAAIIVSGVYGFAQNGPEADLEGFARLPIALILVNTYLPDLSGDEVVARVNAAFPRVPVLHLDEVFSGSFDLDGLLQSVRALTTGRSKLHGPTQLPKAPPVRSFDSRLAVAKQDAFTALKLCHVSWGLP